MKNPSQKIADLIEDIISHRLDVITDSDWFMELVDQKVRGILEENKYQVED